MSDPDDDDRPARTDEARGDGRDDDGDGPTCLVGHAVKFLENHTVPFGTVSETTTCEDSGGLIPGRVRVAIEDALVAAAEYLARTFDGS